MENLRGRLLRPAPLCPAPLWLVRRDSHASHWARAAGVWLLALAGTASPAWAQTAPPAAPTAPKPAPGTPASAPASAPATPAAQALPRFDIYQYVVEGNSVLGEDAIMAAVTPHLGERKTLRDVEAARAALEKRYHEAGFLTVLVSIPAQQVDGGEVRLQITEAAVERLKVAGAQYTLPSGLKAQVPELAEGNVPNFNKMQEQLAVANRRADARVTPVLRAGKLPGTVEVQLDVEDQLPLHGTLEVNNRQSANTTPTRVSAGLRYDNLWQAGHSLSVNLQTAPQRSSDTRVAAFSYTLPTGRGQDVVSLFVVHSRSAFASLASSPGLGLLGNSDTYGLRWTQPLGANREAPQTLSAGLDLKDVHQTLVLVGGETSPSPIKYVPVVLSWNLALPGPAHNSAFDATATLGLDRLFGNSAAAFTAKRSGASPSFMALRLGAQHSRSLAGWTLLGRVDTQLATGPLVPTEQMSAGGADTVRGYLEGERAGDLGLRASAEVRTPSFAPAGTVSAWRIGGLVFVDAARLGVLQAVAPQAGHYSLAGAGLGLRVSAPGGLNFEVDVARALRQGDSTQRGDNRVHARATWGY